MAARVLCSTRSCSSGQLRLSAVELQHCEGVSKEEALVPKWPTVVITVFVLNVSVALHIVPLSFGLPWK